MENEKKHVYFCYECKTILKSIDDGLSFLLVEQGHRDGFTAIIQSSEDRLFTVGEKGVELLK